MTRLTRRHALRTLYATTLAAAFAPGGAPARGAARAAEPATAVDVYAKIRGSLRPELVPFWYRGVAMVALQDDMPRPFLGVEGFSYTRFTREADGAWMTVMTEVGYFTRLDDASIVDETSNPLNGKSIKPRHFVSGAQKLRVQQDGSVHSQRDFQPPAEFYGRIGSPLRQGPEIWVDEDLLARFPSDLLPPTLRDPGPTRLLSLGTLTTYRSLAQDVANPRLVSTPCTFHLQELSNLPTWFELGDVVGKQLWRLSGRKLDSVAEIPTALRSRIERDHPTFIRDPGI